MKRIVRKYTVPHESNQYRPYLLRTVGMLVLIGLFIVGLSLSGLYQTILKTNDFIASVLPAVLTDLANSDRSTNQLNSLTVNSELEEAARLKADDMAAKGYFSHNTPEGYTPWYWINKAGYSFLYAGENLAINFDDSVAVNDAWMNSPGHRANIMNGHFTEIGIATSRGIYQGRETTFVVQMFASPASEADTDIYTSIIKPANQNPNSTTTKSAVSQAVTVPIDSSTVLGETSSQTFVAVKNVEEISSNSPQTASLNRTTISYANLFERTITSPTKLLAIFYVFLSLILLISLISVIVVKHNRRIKHIALVFMLIAIITGLFYAYRAFVFSGVIVLSYPESFRQQISK